jgi:uncharacterized membrane protein
MTRSDSGGRYLNIDAALLAYLIPVLGPAYILALRKEDAFSRFHARQSLLIVLALILAPAVWILFSWLVAFLPFGGVIAAYVFALVIAVYLAVVVAWVAGIVNALRARRSPVPFFGRLLG